MLEHGLDLDALDLEGRPGQPHLRLTGRRILLRSAPQVPWSALLAMHQHWGVFLHYVVVNNDDQTALRQLPIWQIRAVVHWYRGFAGMCDTFDDNRRLAVALTRYGRAVEADLAGHDVAGLWQTRRWRRLLNLIDQLPRASLYVEALSLDPALASPRDPHDKAKPVRRMSEWSPDVELLSVAADRLADVVNAVASLGRAKPHKVPAMPRPVTASDRITTQRRQRRHSRLVARVLPGTASDETAPPGP